MLRKLRKNYRRLVAFMLTVAMTFTNVGTNLNVAFAAGEEQEALFLVDGEDLQEAIRNAIDDGGTFRFSSLELAARTKSLKASYEKLLGGKNGAVYQLDVDVDERYAPEGTSVEVFYNAGTEDVIFLFINESDMVVKFRASVDGYETARVVINPNAANVDDTEASYVENYENSDMVNDVSQTLGAEVLNPTTGAADADQETDADTEETSEAAEGTAADETTGDADGTGAEESSVAPETTEAGETSNDTDEPEETTAAETGDTVGEETTAAETLETETEKTEAEETDAETEAQEAEVETEAETEVEAEVETDAETEAEAEPETEAAPEEGSATAGISLRKLQQVASSVKVLDDADIVIDPENVTGDQETEVREDSDVAVETEEETETETESAETTEAREEETRAAETEETTAEETDADQEESSAAQETTEAGEQGDADDTDRETSGDADRENPGEDESSGADIVIEETTADAGAVSPSETPVKVEETTAAETEASGSNDGAGQTDPAEEDGQELEDDINGTLQNYGSLDSKAYGTVTIWGQANARAVRVSLAAISEIAGTVEEDSYTLYIGHVLTAREAQYVKYQVISLEESEFVDGQYDLGSYEYEKEGMQISGSVPVITAGDFEEEDGESTAYVELNYEIQDGWHIVPESSRELDNGGISLLSMFIGDLDELILEPDEDVLVVTVNILDEDEIPMQVPDSFEVPMENGKFTFSYKIPEFNGYQAELSDGKGVTLAGGTLTGTLTEAGEIEVNLIYRASETVYHVKHLFQTLDGEYEEKAEYPAEEIASTVGTVTQAEAKYVEGFTPMGISQEVVQPEGTTEIEVRYNRNEYSLLFDTMGGSYIPTITGKYETQVALARVEKPSRTGYTFVGWYEDEELTQPVTSVTMDSDKRVYAKWDGATVDYKVVYLKENANDADYSYAGTVTLQAKAGTQVTANANTTKPAEFNKDNDAGHFKFISSETKTVEADGSTVIQVKYNRKLYTITFEGTHCDQAEKTLNCSNRVHSFLGHSDSCYKWNCPVHGDGEACLKITAKYGAFIGDEWNRLVGPGTAYEGSQWTWSGTSKTTYQSVMPAGDKSLPRSTSSGTERNLYYYVEDPTGTETAPNDNTGKKFRQINHVKINMSGGYPTFEEEFYSMEGIGYTRYRSNVSNWENGTNGGRGSWGNSTLKFYYTLKDYELALNNLADTTVPRTETVKYTASIADILAEEEARFEADVFGGWYLDPECTKPYEGDKTMPMGLVLYAKKVVKTYKVEFVDSENTDNKYNEQEVEEGKPSNNSGYPEKDGKIFDGWYTDPECTQKFDINSPITADTRVYAKWRESSTINYTVRHVTADGDTISEYAATGSVGEMVVIKAIKPGTVNPDYADYNVPDSIQVERRLTRGENNDITITYSRLADLTYEIRYEYNGETISGLSEGEKPARAYQITIQADMKKLTEQGWQLAAGETSRKMVSLVSDNTKNVFIFQLAPASYRITYDLDGGALAAGVTNPVSYTPAEMTESIILGNPSKEGYTFTGWQLTTGKVGGGNAYNAMQVEIENTSYGHLAFKATYEARKDLIYTVNYYDAETKKELLPSRTEKDQTFGVTVTENAPEIPGYSVDEAEKKVTIQEDNQENVITFYYTRVSNLNYKVHYIYEDGTSTQTEVVEGSDGTYKDPIPYDSDTPKTYKGKNYVLEKVEKLGDGTITTQEDKNVVKVYYTVDEKSDPDKDPDPSDPGDGIPDKYQITITYVAAAHGTVTALEGGTVQEVRTTREITKNPDGTITAGKDLEVYPYAAVQAVPDAGYKHAGWTGAGSSYENTDEIKAVKITGDTTFTASFDENANVTIFYKATKGGTVTLENESLKPATGQAKGSTAQASDGYRFVKWTDENGDEVAGSDTLTYVPTKPGAVWVEASYTANFTERTDLSYEVHYYYDGVEDTDSAVHEPNGTFGGEIPYDKSGTTTYQEKNYTLEKIEKPSNGIITTDTEKNVVKVYYLLDEKGPDGTPDNIPDQYQITITYKAGANGTVTPEENGSLIELHTVKTFDRDPEDGTITNVQDKPANPAALVVAAANPGYEFVNWTSDGDQYTDVSAIRALEVSQDKEFQANFTARTDLKYEIHYYYDGTRASDKDRKGTGTLNAEIQYDAPESISYNKRNYTLEKIEKLSRGIITADEDKNIVEIYYVLDEEGPDGKPDGIPDQYQVKVEYVSGGNGKLEGTLKELLTTVEVVRDPVTQVILSTTPVEAHPAAEVTTIPDDGYQFEGWTSVSTEGEQEAYQNTEAIRALDIRGNKVFTASFTKRTDLQYQIHYYFGKEGDYTRYTEATELAVGPVNGTFGDKIPYEAPISRTYGEGENAENYTLEHIDAPSGGIITTTITDNVVRIYYTLDAEGPDGTSDNIPDKYQIHITYEVDAADAANGRGTLAGTTGEFHTVAEILRDPDNQTIIEVKENPAAPKANVTPQPADGYKFVNWTSGGSSYKDVSDIRKLALSQDTTFTAHFTENSNVTIYYVATEGGTVTKEHEGLAPATGGAEGSTAQAADGYRFVNWTDENGKEVGDAETFIPVKTGAVWVDGTTYTANFTRRTDLHYEVHYFYGNGGEYEEDTDSRVMEDNGRFNDPIPYNPLPSTEYNGKTYTLEKIEKPSDGKITTDSEKNVVNVYYLLDQDGPEDKPDGIPDSYQIRITYVSGANGTVTGRKEEFHTVWTFDRNEDGTINMDTLTSTPARPEASVTATADPGYQFAGWTTAGPDGTITYDSVERIRELTLSESKEFQAGFTARTDLDYTVRYFYDGTEDNVGKVDGKGTLDTAIPYQDKAPRTSQFGGKNYMLESIDITFSNGMITADETKNVVKIHYTLDADGPDGSPDGIPDKWQIRITYKAGANGQVIGTTTEFHTVMTFELNADNTINKDSVKSDPATPAAAVTARPESGYRFVDWTSASMTGQQESYDTTKDIQALEVSKNKEFTANFTARTDLSYEVHYFYDETEDKDKEVTDGKGTLNASIPYDDARTTEYNGKTYMLERIDAPSKGIITPEEKDNVVKIYYTLDEDGENGQSDGTPDKWQIRITYKAEANGQVAGTLTEFYTIATFDRNDDGTISNVVVTPVNPRAEVTAQPDDGYELAEWTSGGSTFKDVARIRQEKVDKNTEYTAAFTEKTDLKYEVHYFYDEKEDETKKVENEGGKFGDAIFYNDDPTSVFNGQNYVLEQIEKPSNGIISNDETKNVVNIYYTLDEDGEKGQSDGIPDKWQIRIIYRESAGGQVTGTKEEFHTIKTFTREPDGTFTNVTDAPATPAADVSVTPDPGYRFVDWTSGGDRYEKTEDIQKLSLTVSKVFTANFAGREDLKYEIHYFYGQEGSYQDYPEAVNLAVKKDNGVLGTAFWQTAELTSQYEGKSYTLEHIEKPTGGIVTADESDNIVNIYYTLDADGADGQSDGIPDKYQIRLKYEAGANGTLAETVPGAREEFHTVKTFTRNSDGTISGVQDAPAQPAAAVEPVPGPGYKLTNWSDGATSYTDTDAIRGRTFMESTTFTAEFAELSDVTLRYEATAGGTVTPTQESLPPATGTARGSTANPKDGYVFVNWTSQEGAPVSDEKTFRPTKEPGTAWIDGTTYTANFTKRTDLKYEVHYFYDKTEDESQKVLGTNGTFGAQIIDYTPAQTSTFNGKNYVLESIERPSGGIITTREDSNIVRIYYTLDADGPDGRPDGTPDKFQIHIRYVAGANGSLEGITQEVHTVKTFDRNPDGTISNVQDAPAAPKADVRPVPGDGYRFVSWSSGSDRYDGAGEIQALSITRDTTFVAEFTARADLRYSVHYLYDGVEDKDKEVIVTSGTFGAVIPYTADPASSFAGRNYVLERIEKPSSGIITTSISRNIVNIYYTLDENGPEGKEDGIPDKYQVTFTYQAEANAHGTVTGTTSEVKTIREIQKDAEGIITSVGAVTPAKPAQPSTISADTGYHFDKWTDESGNEYKDDAALKAAGFAVNKTFTARFTPDAQTYTVQHVDEDTDRIIETSEAKATIFGAVINGVNEKVKLNGYAFVKADDLTVGIDNSKNIVKVYYSTDTWSDPKADPELDLDPETPGDGIPDKYQITFTYVAKENGAVTGTTTEVATIRQIERNPETGVITLKGEETPVHPTQPSTVKANEGYYFLQWNDGSEDLVNDDAVRGKTYLKDTTFHAYFEASPNNLWEASKKVTNIPSRGYYRVGENATFEITVRMKPGANRPLQDITLREQLAGAYFVEYANCGYTVDADIPGLARIDRLEPGQTVVLRATYKVTRNDLLGSRKFQNIVRIEGKNDMSTVTPNEPDRKDVEVLEPGTGDIPAGRQNGGSGSSGGGGGGGSSTRSPGTGDGAAGPGIPTVTIDPDAVPLANLPDMGNDDILALIDDEDVPLAALPKTGQATSAALMLMISSMMLAAFAVVTRKKEDEQ